MKCLYYDTPWEFIISFIDLLVHNGLYMMTPHPCQIPPRSKQTHIHQPTTTYTHTHTAPINGHKFDPSQAWHLRPRGHSVSLTTPHVTHTHILAHTQTSTFFPSLPPSFPWHTCQGPHWPLTPSHLALLLIFPPTLSIWDEEVRTGELVAIFRCNGGDGEDEGERSMHTDGWACRGRNNSQPWRKSKGLQAKRVRNTDGGEKGEGLSCLFIVLCFGFYWYTAKQKNEKCRSSCNTSASHCTLNTSNK